MLEHYFIKPDTIDNIRNSWLGEAIEQYVDYLHKESYTARSISRRVPLLMHFGEFAKDQGAQTWKDLPSYVDKFVNLWVQERGQKRKSNRAKKEVDNETRGPIQQFLRVILPPDYYCGTGRSPANTPFLEQVPGFFSYLQEERGLRAGSIYHYKHCLSLFQKYLIKIKFDNIEELSPVILSAFIIDNGGRLSKSTITGL